MPAPDTERRRPVAMATALASFHDPASRMPATLPHSDAQPATFPVPPSAEFALLCEWLGRCSRLRILAKGNGLTREPVPTLEADFAPGRTCLIQVRVKAERRLSFKADHFEAMLNYAEKRSLPLLVAWKHYSSWTLVHAGHFRRTEANYRVNLDLARELNLLGILAGDYAWSLSPTVSVIVDDRHVAPPGEKSEANPRMSARILDVYGRRLPDCTDGVWRIIDHSPLAPDEAMTEPGSATFRPTGELGFTQSIIVTALHRGSGFCAAGTNARSTDTAHPGGGPCLPELNEILADLAVARGLDIAEHVFVQRPLDTPEFLL